MKLVFYLILFLVHLSYVKIGHGIGVENSPKLLEDESRSNTSVRSSLKESPAPNISIPPGNGTEGVSDSNILSVLAAVIPKMISSGDADSVQYEKEAAKLSYFEPKVLYTTIPIIVVCMVALGLLAEYFGEGIETGR